MNNNFVDNKNNELYTIHNSPTNTMRRSLDRSMRSSLRRSKIGKLKINRELREKLENRYSNGLSKEYVQNHKSIELEKKGGLNDLNIDKKSSINEIIHSLNLIQSNIFSLSDRINRLDQCIRLCIESSLIRELTNIRYRIESVENTLEHINARSKLIRTDSISIEGVREKKRTIWRIILTPFSLLIGCIRIIYSRLKLILGF